MNHFIPCEQRKEMMQYIISACIPVIKPTERCNLVANPFIMLLWLSRTLGGLKIHQYEPQKVAV